MSTVTEATEPGSSTEITVALTDRFSEVAHNHSRVSELLRTHELDGLVIRQPSNFAWFTSGADCTRRGAPDPVAALFVTRDSRLIATRNCDSPHIFDKELPQLGFHLKERPWQEPREVLIEDLCRGRKVGADGPLAGALDVSEELRKLRLVRTETERRRLRHVAQRVAHAVEATGRNLEVGQTEAEIAGQLAHRLVQHEVVPVQLQVLADGRGARYRRAGYGSDELQHSCVISAIGRRWGLCAGATRTVCFGPPPAELRSGFQVATLVLGAAIQFSRPGITGGELFGKLRRLYEKFDYPEDWRLCDQGAVIGYEPVEVSIVPNSDFQLQAGMALHWHPSAGPALVGDTILPVDDDAYEALTLTDLWPQTAVAVRGALVPCSDILIREQ